MARLAHQSGNFHTDHTDGRILPSINRHMFYAWQTVLINNEPFILTDSILSVRYSAFDKTGRAIRIGKLEVTRVGNRAHLVDEADCPIEDLTSICFRFTQTANGMEFQYLNKTADTVSMRFQIS